MNKTDKHFHSAAVYDETGKGTETVKKSLNDQGIETIVIPDIASLEKKDVDTDLLVCVVGSEPAKEMPDLIKESLRKSPVMIATRRNQDHELDEKFVRILTRLNYCRDYVTQLDGEKENPFRDLSESDLSDALSRREFEVWYQPVHRSEDRTLSGFEALIRWKDPKTGEIIFPDRFMPVIERKEFIVPFGFWIIEEACRQLSLWNGVWKGYPLKIGVNLSARQFTCSELVDRIIQIIDKFSLDPSTVALEITESTFMEDMESANLMLLTLRSKNILIYLDDFGTGFSSLSYLLHFPVNTIKIDKSFVKWMHVDEQSEEIVKSIIAMAHNLKMKVVAEGVELPEHVDMLREFGCNFLQGFHFSKPISGKDATAFLHRHQ